jgi:DNA-binding beta-propeller fold protein YncE
MREAVRSAGILCALLLVSCSDGPPMTANETGGGADAPSLATTTANSSCTSPGHPGTIVDKVTAPTPWGVAVREDGVAWFTEVFNNSVGFTSTRTRTVDGSVVSGNVPTGIAFSPDGATAYVANQFGAAGVYDVATRQLTDSIVISNPLAVRVAPDGSQLFVATGNTQVFVVNLPSLEIVNTIEVGFAPNGFAVHPDGRILYVSSFIGGTVSEIDMYTKMVLRTFPVGGTPQEMALNRKGTRLYVANEAGYLNEIDLTTGQEAPHIPLQGGGFGVGVTPDDGQAYVTEPSAGVIQTITLQTRKIAKTFAVGGEPRRVAFSQQGHIAAATNAAGFITFIR